MSDITKILPAHIIRLYVRQVLEDNNFCAVTETTDGLIPTTVRRAEPQIAGRARYISNLMVTLEILVKYMKSRVV